MRPFAPIKQYALAAAGVVLLTFACWLMTPPIGYTAIAPVYLLGVVLAGMTLSRGPVLLVAALSALAWNFLFIPPRFTLHIAEVQDALMFVTYFIVALAIGSLTNRLKAREHLAAQAQIALESERLRKTLLDCLSHELKTPLAAITSASQQLETNPELSRALASEIRHGSQRLNRVVNNLLDMTRVESGVVRPKLEWCDVRELLESAIATAREDFPDRSFVLSLPNEFPLAFLDYSLIEQAVTQLLVNAGNYAAGNLPVELVADFPDGHLTIRVLDAGPGLPPDTARLFEKFHRGEGSKTGGLGLGLSIARGFVEAHGGKLTAENRTSGGAQFTITLSIKTTDRSALETATA